MTSFSAFFFLPDKQLNSQCQQESNENLQTAENDEGIWMLKAD